MQAIKQVERYAREIVPAFNACLYFRIACWLGRSISRALYRVRIGYIDEAGLARRARLQDRTLLAEGRACRARTVLGTLRFLLHNLSLLLRSEWHRFGYACVNFGAPLSMREYCRSRALDFHQLAGEDRRRAMSQLGAELMAAVPRRDLDCALTVGLRMLRLRRLVVEREGLLSARPEELPLLRYYANSIAHLLEPLDEGITLQ